MEMDWNGGRVDLNQATMPSQSTGVEDLGNCVSGDISSSSSSAINESSLLLDSSLACADGADKQDISSCSSSRLCDSVLADLPGANVDTQPLTAQDLEELVTFQAEFDRLGANKVTEDGSDDKVLMEDCSDDKVLIEDCSDDKVLIEDAQLTLPEIEDVADITDVPESMATVEVESAATVEVATSNTVDFQISTGSGSVTTVTIPCDLKDKIILPDDLFTVSSSGKLVVGASKPAVSTFLDQGTVVVNRPTTTTATVATPVTTKAAVYSSTGSPMIAKVIITSNSLTGNYPVMTIPVTSGSGSSSVTPTVKILTTSQAQGLAPGSTKSVTLANFNQQNKAQIITTLPSTPPRQTLMVRNKMPISPSTSARIAVVPTTITKSPQRIAPAPMTVTTVQMLTKGTMISAGGAQSTTTLTTAIPKVSTLAVSPSKVIIKPASSTATTATMPSSTVKQLTFTSTSSAVQPIQVPGSKFSYIRLVTAPIGGTTAVRATGVRPATIAPATTVRPIIPATVQTQSQSGQPSGQVKLVPIPSMVTTNKQGVSQQRFLIPSSSVASLTQVRPSMSTSSGSITVPAGATLAQFSPGTTFISSEGSIVMVPAQYVAQQQLAQSSGVQQASTVSSPAASPHVASTAQQSSRQQTSLVSIAAAATLDHASMASSARPHINGSVVEPNGVRPRKPCNCTKSQCLKLYCDCFANGEFCHNCNCSNCYNNLEHEDVRQHAIKACLERNPQAFHPKIGKGKVGEQERRHNKGCNCKRSGCLKNYCECYEAKIMCSSTCKCVGCKNFEESAERKTLMHLADAAEVRVQQQTAAKTKLSSQIFDVAFKPSLGAASSERFLCSFITTEVVEATCHCLLAQAEEVKDKNLSDAAMEQRVIEEFGRCLVQIIEYANKTKV